MVEGDLYLYQWLRPHPTTFLAVRQPLWIFDWGPSFLASWAKFSDARCEFYLFIYLYFLRKGDRTPKSKSPQDVNFDLRMQWLDGNENHQVGAMTTEDEQCVCLGSHNVDCVCMGPKFHKTVFCKYPVCGVCRVGVNGYIENICYASFISMDVFINPCCLVSELGPFTSECTHVREQLYTNMSYWSKWDGCDKL